MKYVILALDNLTGYTGIKPRLVEGVNPATLLINKVKVFDTYGEAELFLDLILYKVEGVPNHIIVPFPVDRESALILEQATERLKKPVSLF
jgi:hypothetical protein